MKYITIVCGGRHNIKVDPWKEFFSKTRTDLVITGGATGADWTALMIAELAGIEVIRLEPEEGMLGTDEGFRNNFHKASLADCYQFVHGSAVQVVAVNGGAGTNNMLETAKQFGFKIHMLEGKGK